MFLRSIQISMTIHFVHNNYFSNKPKVLNVFECGIDCSLLYVVKAITKIVQIFEEV